MKMMQKFKIYFYSKERNKESYYNPDLDYDGDLFGAMQGCIPNS